MVSAVAGADKGGDVRDRRLGVDLHEQTGLSAGAVADNDELATDLGHFERVGGSVGDRAVVAVVLGGQRLAGEMRKGG